MQFTLSFRYEGTEEYLIRLSSVDLPRFLSKDVALRVAEQVEVVEICLERIRGSKPTSITILMHMSRIIAKFFEQNDNVILYFFCDDLNDIPRRQKDMSPQEFRSKLFSQMFCRCSKMQHIQAVENISICIDSSGWKNFIHFLVREKHKPIMEMIQRDVIEGFGK